MRQTFQRKAGSNRGHEPLVSIVIPIYNVECFLGDCLRSVTKQTYECLEVICVIDGSTDSSEKIAREYGTLDDRFKVICQSNQGLSVARNTGVEASNGEFLFFLDADDWMEHNAITNLVHAAISSNCKVISGAVIEHWQHSGKQRPYWRKNRRKLGRLELQRQRFFLLESMVWNKLYRRDVALKAPFTPGLIHEDLDFYWRVFSECPVVYAIEAPVIYYRRREGSLSSAQSYGLLYQHNFIEIFDCAWTIAKRNPTLKTVVEKKALKYLEVLKTKQAPHEKYKRHINDHGIQDTKVCYALISVKTWWDHLLTKMNRV